MIINADIEMSKIDIPTKYSPSKTFVSKKVKLEDFKTDDYDGYDWSKYAKNDTDLGNIDLYENWRERLQYFTGDVGRYIRNPELDDFIARPKIVGDGRYSVAKDVGKPKYDVNMELTK